MEILHLGEGRTAAIIWKRMLQHAGVLVATGVIFWGLYFGILGLE